MYDKRLRSNAAFLAVGVIGFVILVADVGGWFRVPSRADSSQLEQMSSRLEQVSSGPPTVVAVAAERIGTVQRSDEVDLIFSVDKPARSQEPAQDVFEPPRPGPTPTPRSHEVRAGDSLLEIAASYGVSVEAITQYNELWDPNRLRVGQVLAIPSPRYVVQSTAEETQGELRLWWPIQGEITTYFGQEEPYYLTGAHTGMDLAANHGVPVRASAPGKVVVAWKRPDNVGWHIVVDHGNGYSTLYGHLSSFSVDVGDTVKRGEVIGAVGNTGFSLGPHLHLEVRKWGVPQDPLDYLP